MDLVQIIRSLSLTSSACSLSSVKLKEARVSTLLYPLGTRHCLTLKKVLTRVALWVKLTIEQILDHVD